MADNKISREQNGHSADLVLGKTNPHPRRTETPPKGKQSTFEEMQEQLREDWKNANFEEDISYKTTQIRE